MGFTTGFTGGLTLTLAIAYISTVAQQHAREQQSLLVQQQTRTLDATIDRPPAPLRPTRAELAAATRANFVDSAKDRWNSELEGAVRWLQSADWGQAREKLENKVGVLVGVSGVDEAASKVGAGVHEQAVEVKQGVLDAVEKGISKSKDVVDEVKSLTSSAIKGAGAVADEVVRPESEVEKALRQRYEKNHMPTKTVAEALKERYLPLGQRDNTLLRGI